MFIRKALQALEILNQNDVQHVRDFCAAQNSMVITKNNSEYLYSTIGPGLLATILSIPNLKFTIETHSITRTTLNKTNLDVTPLQHRASLDDADRDTQRRRIIRFLTNCRAYNTAGSGHFFYIIKANSGHTILKPWLEHAGYESISIDFPKPYPEYKANLYVIEKDIVLVTDDIDVPETYTKILGWFPVLFKEAFKDLKSYPELYEFYKNCFKTNSVNRDCLNKIPVIKNIKSITKIRVVDEFLKDLNEFKKIHFQTHIDRTQNDIAQYELALRTLYTTLNNLLKQQAFGTTVENIDLIEMCLKNNPNVQTIAFENSKINITLYGPVEYDKKEMAKMLKHQSDFVNWLLLHPDYTLCWESQATLNTEENKIYTEKRLNSPTKLIRNTHWHRYACLGNNRSPIEKALAASDYLSAITQTITAAQSLNVYDYTVLSALIEDLTYSRNNHYAFKCNNNDTILTTFEMREMFNEEKRKEKENNGQQNNSEQ